MKNVHKTPLNLNDYSRYEIDQEYTAYIIKFSGISEKEAEDYEYEYVLQGYKIFSSQLERSKGDQFELTLILARLIFKM